MKVYLYIYTEYGFVEEEVIPQMLTTKMVDELLMTIKTEATQFSDQASTGQPCGDAISINLDRKSQQRSLENRMLVHQRVCDYVMWETCHKPFKGMVSTTHNKNLILGMALKKK